MELIKPIDVTERPAAFCRRAGAPRRRAGTTVPGVPGGGRARLQGPGRNASGRVALLRCTMGGPLLARARDFVGPALLWGKKAAGHCTRTCSSTPTPDGLEGPARQRSYWSYVRRLVQGAPEPPYLHVCQVGDPALRAVAARVEPAQLAGPELQQLVQRLVQVMRRRRCVGLSAPQLGVPLQVLALEFPEALFRACAPRFREVRQMEPFPLRVFVNPSLRVLDSRLVTFPEGCESVAGFLACVPRFQAVQISGAGWQRHWGGWVNACISPACGGRRLGSHESPQSSSSSADTLMADQRNLLA